MTDYEVGLQTDKKDLVSLLETTLNTRDLGEYRSEITGRELRSWSVLRSDVQNYPSDRDVEFLKRYNITTIIDLRSEKEVQRKTSGFADKPGFAYFNVPIEEGSGIPETVSAVSESYMKIAESKNIARVFMLIAAASGGVMYNCTAGKDRTGVVSAILLGLCGVADDTIVADYMISKILNRERFEMIRQNFPDIDMNIVIPQERYMIEFIEALKGKYGGYREYLNSIGVTNCEIKKILTKFF